MHDACTLKPVISLLLNLFLSGSSYTFLLHLIPTVGTHTTSHSSLERLGSNTSRLANRQQVDAHLRSTDVYVEQHNACRYSIEPS